MVTFAKRSSEGGTCVTTEQATRVVPEAFALSRRQLPTNPVLRWSTLVTTAAMPSLHDMQVMIVEDDTLLAIDLAEALRDAGLQVIGPFSTVDGALHGVAAHRPQAAILDIDLRGQLSFPVADALAGANVPFLWLSGSSPNVLPEHHRGRPFVRKPLAKALILRMLADLLKTS